MIPDITTLTFFVLWAAGVSQSVLITQWPRYISRLPDGSAEMHCYQNDTDYQYLYWYRQLRGKDIQLVVYLLAGSATFEEEFKSGFQAVTLTEKQWSLTISSVQEKDEAVYLCAPCISVNYNPAYFGSGTKLTVLDPKREITPPTVKVFQPSSKECRNLKDEKERKKTLLCVARDFYPDHVSIFWQVNAKNVTKGVATDPAARLDDKTYFITSRLRVHAEVWTSPGTNFSCFVTFFDGNKTIIKDETVFAVEGMFMWNSEIT
ncbi:immunoglobulin lambda-1 light chain-like [Seriola lalandi dorsalis]|uniref:immunoglobulin lambda-1 light chain-like n=1 Tax=Seriola lalandi dorsalis TaxID=1841481 RepID=UPI000C6FB42E|nr:immunoglobulin lambda-1 light chain-like [Seriola lalandi dorsalis]